MPSSQSTRCGGGVSSGMPGALIATSKWWVPGEAPAMHNPHLDQLGHMTGELTLHGEKIALDRSAHAVHPFAQQAKSLLQLRQP